MAYWILKFFCYITLNAFMDSPFLEQDRNIKDGVVIHFWRKFNAFVTCVHISFKFGYK